MESTAYTILLSLIASSGLWSVILYIVQSRDKRREARGIAAAERLERVENAVAELREDNEILKSAQLAQMFRSLTKQCSEILTEYADGARRCVDVDEMHGIDIQYDAYARLGGNSTGRTLYEAVKALPIRQTNKP